MIRKIAKFSGYFALQMKLTVGHSWCPVRDTLSSKRVKKAIRNVNKAFFRRVAPLKKFLIDLHVLGKQLYNLKMCIFFLDYSSTPCLKPP